jgi:heme-degrading monooxygenase HmoA
MHARMFTFEGSPEEIEAAIGVARDQILPLERQMSGFRGLILLAHEETQKLVSLSLWESEESMLQSEESARTLTRSPNPSAGSAVRSSRSTSRCSSSRTEHLRPRARAVEGATVS